MTPAERANAAMGWIVASHGWAAGAFDAVVKQIHAAIAEERAACATIALRHHETELTEADGSRHCCGVDETCGAQIAAVIGARL